MSFYNMFFGTNEKAIFLLKCLGFSKEDVPRFRDCFIAGNTICIYTRTGGDNRYYYDNKEIRRSNYPDHFEEGKEHNGPWNDDLRKNLNYLTDIDDDFDCTYANFFFKFPDEYKNDLEALAKQSVDYTPSEKWKILLNSFENSKGK